jgi:hypothetical protein
MPTGRRIVVSAWARLPEEVLNGPLTNIELKAPLRRIALPLLRELFRGTGYSPQDVYATTSFYEGTDVDIIRSHITDAADRIVQLSRFLELLDRRLDSAGVPSATDPVRTAAVGEFFRVSPPNDAALEGAADELSARLAAGHRSAESGEVADLPGLRAAFSDPTDLERFQRLLGDAFRSAARDPEPDADTREEFDEQLGVFLDGVGFLSRQPIVDADGERAWDRAVALDAPRLDTRGLTARPAPEQPAVHHPLRRGADKLLPLDTAIFERIWSTVRGALSREWRHELPPLRDLVERELRGAAQPFGLATAEARAAFAAGQTTYRDTMPTAFLLPPADYRREVARLTAAARFTTTAVRSFLVTVRASPADAWSALSPRAQNELLALDLVALPALWWAIHNAQYRPDRLSPSGVWGLIRGEVQSLVGDIRKRHKLRTEGASVEMPDSTAAESTASADDGIIDRDDRVRATMQHFSDSRGAEALGDFFSGLLHALADVDAAGRDAVRAEWAAVGDEMRRGEATGELRFDDRSIPLVAEAAAAWDDLLGYLDDHFPR